MLLDVGLLGIVYIVVRSKTSRHIIKSLYKSSFPIKKTILKPTLNIKQHANLRIIGGGSMIMLALLPTYLPYTILLQLIIASYLTFPAFKLAESALIEEKKLRAPVLTSLFYIACISIGAYIALGIGALFFTLARKIVDQAKQDLKTELTYTFQALPDTVWVIKNGIEIALPLSEVTPGDIISVNSGNTIPVDGLIVEGNAIVDQQQLTGEYQPAEKTVGDNVLAATIVLNGQIQIKTEQAGSATTAAKIDALLNNTANFKSNLQLRGETWADQTVLPSLAAAALSFPILHSVTGMAAILDCSFETRIMMLAPLGTLNHLKLASEKAIFIKDGCALEMACEIDTILFDKTGTLTSELPEIRSVIVCEGYTEKIVISYAATAEAKMNHPIAQTIIKYAQKNNIAYIEPDVSDYIIGYGVTITTNNTTINVGSRRFILKQAIIIPELIEKAVCQAQQQGYSTILVAANQQLIGMIELRPTLRPEVATLLGNLRKQGIKHLAIVSGDNEIPVKKLAENLGVDDYFSEVLPENKASIVEKLQCTGKKVCFVGDGINDSIAMKQADLSVSLNGATSVATDTAQAILMQDGLARLNDFIHISQALKTNSRRTLGITLIGTGINITGIFLLHFGVTTTMVINVIALITASMNTLLPRLTSKYL